MMNTSGTNYLQENANFLNNNVYPQQNTMDIYVPQPVVKHPYTDKERNLSYLGAGIGGALIGSGIADSITAGEQAKLVFGSGTERELLGNDAETFKKILLNPESKTLDEAVKFLESADANKRAIIQNDEARIHQLLKGTPLKRKLIAAGAGAAATLLLTKMVMDRHDKKYRALAAQDRLRRAQMLRQQPVLQKAAGLPFKIMGAGQYKALKSAAKGGGFPGQAKAFIAGAGVLGAGLYGHKKLQERRMRRMEYGR